ncbi:MAG: shikimate dehydrogenase [Pedosphaera sp.]|nr:shikimate dehydrogenase [Pedosphaera sp.]
MQNAGIAELGLNWGYLAFDVHPDLLRAAIDGARAMKFIGLNLTVPHKLMALQMVDVLDESARTWGAVNTIRFEARVAGGTVWQPLSEIEGYAEMEVRSVGFNTDADAIVKSIEEDPGIKLRGARVLLLGAGGAGRTAALRLAAEGVGELFLVNRTVSKAADVAGEIGKRFPGVPVRVGYPSGPVELVLNATSAGLKLNDPLPLDVAAYPLSQTAAVYDMIYRPAETPLMKAGRAAGCRVTSGIGMLLHQGAHALEIWTGRKAPVAAMRSALLKNVYGT